MRNPEVWRVAMLVIAFYLFVVGSLRTGLLRRRADESTASAQPGRTRGRAPGPGRRAPQRVDDSPHWTG